MTTEETHTRLDTWAAMRKRSALSMAGFARWVGARRKRPFATALEWDELYEEYQRRPIRSSRR